LTANFDYLSEIPPMNAHERTKFTYTSYIAAPPEKVWEALTSAALTEQYWAGRNIVSNWKPGASVQMLKSDGSVDWEGEIITVTPRRLLAYTFLAPRFEAGPPGKPTRVTVELAQQETSVRLTLTHEGFQPDNHSFEGISEGWPAILSSLKSLVETGKAIDFPTWRGK
jgi:uncharacterized protein YndB with AHSA1/START domain